MTKIDPSSDDRLPKLVADKSVAGEVPHPETLKSELGANMRAKYPDNREPLDLKLVIPQNDPDKVDYTWRRLHIHGKLISEAFMMNSVHHP